MALTATFPLRLLLLTTLVLAATFGAVPRAHGAGSGSISGMVFQDLDRDGTRDSGEAPMAGTGIYLLDPAGARQLGFTASDSSGHYSFANLADGDYRVELDPYEWRQIRTDWVPTTTGSVWPRLQVRLAGSASADFGWRPIVRSGDVAAPISEYLGDDGLRVLSYNDAVTARELYDDLRSGSLVGAEASTTTVRFDLGASSVCSTSVSGSPGSYTDYRAGVHIAYLSWLDQGDAVLFHEYGHAWSLYYAHIAQQDTRLRSYLAARGIEGDPRLDTTHAWSRRELVAEDYRQLFGTPNARQLPQENTDLPRAADVPGLREFLSGSYMQAAPAPAPDPSPDPIPPPPAPSPTPPLSVSSAAMNPNPVKSTGTAGFSLSAPASVTVTIRDSRGGLVRTLLQGSARPAGAATIVWDRRNSAGQRVKGGTYTLRVEAVDAALAQAAAAASFAVSK